MQLACRMRSASRALLRVQALCFAALCFAALPSTDGSLPLGSAEKLYDA